MGMPSPIQIATAVECCPGSLADGQGKSGPSQCCIARRRVCCQPAHAWCSQAAGHPSVCCRSRSHRFHVLSHLADSGIQPFSALSVASKSSQ